MLAFRVALIAAAGGAGYVIGGAIERERALAARSPAPVPRPSGPTGLVFGVACDSCSRRLPVGWHVGTGVVSGAVRCDICHSLEFAGRTIQRHS